MERRSWVGRSDGFVSHMFSPVMDEAPRPARSPGAASGWAEPAVPPWADAVHRQMGRAHSSVSMASKSIEDVKGRAVLDTFEGLYVVRQVKGRHGKRAHEPTLRARATAGLMLGCASSGKRDGSGKAQGSGAVTNLSWGPSPGCPAGSTAN